MHNKNTIKSSKRPSILTPLPNPENHLKLEVARTTDFALMNLEEPMHESLLEEEALRPTFGGNE